MVTESSGVSRAGVVIYTAQSRSRYQSVAPTCDVDA